MTIDVTDASFETAVLARSEEVPVVVDLWAPWCGPCRTLGPILERVVDATEGAVELVKVNVDENPQVSTAFRVQSIPAVYALRDGKVVDGFIGAVGEPQVQQFVGRLVTQPSEADELVALGDEAALRKALGLEPDHLGAVLGLAQLLVDKGENEEALALLARVPESPETRHIAALARLASTDGADAELDTRLESLLARVKSDEIARQEYVDLLETISADDPRRAIYRKALSAQLFEEVSVVLGGVALQLGTRLVDLSTRGLVMGIVNRTPDSFYDKGRFFALESCIDRGAELIAAGADLVDIGGVKAGPGDAVGIEEELERVVPVVDALARRFDVPLSIDTFNATVASACFGAGAVLGNDISGFSDPGYLPAAARAGASVVATHIRLRPRVPDPEPRYPNDDVVAAVELFLRDRREQALLAGLAPEQIVVDAGLDLGKTPEQSLALLRASDRLAALGHPLLLSASNKTFLGRLLDLEIDERREVSLAAAALGFTRGCRIFRVHDVAGTRRVLDTLHAVVGQ